MHHDYDASYDDDVHYGMEPTAAQMRRFYDRDFGTAHHNVLTLLVDGGAMTAREIRGAVLHSEHTIAALLRMWVDAEYIALRADGKYAVGWLPASHLARLAA